MTLPNKKLELASKVGFFLSIFYFKGYSCCFLNHNDVAIGLQSGNLVIVDVTTMTIKKTVRAHSEGVILFSPFLFNARYVQLPAQTMANCS
jgi:hypothetical protein